MNIVALIPARSGSKRIPNKNVRELTGHPLLAYTIAAARESGIFGGIFVSTDSGDYAEIAAKYGASVWLRPEAYAADDSPDFEWLNHGLSAHNAMWPTDAFAILRPTSPFRTADTIRRAWAQFQQDPSSYDSLRAVERVKQHPNKMWLRAGSEIVPYNPQIVVAHGVRQPAHSVPSQLLPETLVQNASLEIAWTKTLRQGNISGSHVLGFFTEGWEGYDLNTEEDWLFAEMLVERGLATLPIVPQIEPAFIRVERATTRKRKVHA